MSKDSPIEDKVSYLLLTLIKNGLTAERVLAKKLDWNDSTLHYKLRRLKTFNVIITIKPFVDPFLLSKKVEIVNSDHKLDYSLISFKTSEGQWTNIYPSKFVSKIENKKASKIAKNMLFSQSAKNRILTTILKVKLVPQIDLKKVNFKLVISSDKLSKERIIWSFDNMNVYWTTSSYKLSKEDRIIDDYQINEEYFYVLLAKYIINRNNILKLVEALIRKININYNKTQYGLLIKRKFLISDNLGSLFLPDNIRKILIDKSLNVTYTSNSYNSYNIYNIIYFLHLIE